MKTAVHLLLLLTFAALLSACTSITATLSGKTAEELDEANLTEAKHLLQTLENKNSSLKNFKGIGKIKVWHNAQVQIDERVAWVGSDPLKIRIAVLISGFPAVKLASDGQWFYYLEVQGNTHVFKKIRASNANLKRLIAIPIHSNDVITFLAGRIPVREYHSAYIQSNSSSDGHVLFMASEQAFWKIPCPSN